MFLDKFIKNSRQSISGFIHPSSGRNELSTDMDCGSCFYTGFGNHSGRQPGKCSVVHVVLVSADR